MAEFGWIGPCQVGLGHPASPAEAKMEETAKEPPERDLTAEVMEIHGSEIETLQADQVHMHLGGAQKIEASDVFMQQSVAALFQARHRHIHHSPVIAVRGETVTVSR